MPGPGAPRQRRHAEMVSRYPDRFPASSPRGAQRPRWRRARTNRAIRDLGAAGINCIATWAANDRGSRVPAALRGDGRLRLPIGSILPGPELSDYSTGIGRCTKSVDVRLAVRDQRRHGPHRVRLPLDRFPNLTIIHPYMARWRRTARGAWEPGGTSWARDVGRGSLLGAEEAEEAYHRLLPDVFMPTPPVRRVRRDGMAVLPSSAPTGCCSRPTRRSTRKGTDVHPQNHRHHRSAADHARGARANYGATRCGS